MRGFTVERGMPVVPSGEEFERAAGNMRLLASEPKSEVAVHDPVADGIAGELPEVVQPFREIPPPWSVDEIADLVDERVSLALLAESCDTTYPVDTLAVKQWCLEQANALPVCDDRFGYAKKMYEWAMSDVTNIVEYTPRRPRRTHGR